MLSRSDFCPKGLVNLWLIKFIRRPNWYKTIAATKNKEVDHGPAWDKKALIETTSTREKRKHARITQIPAKKPIISISTMIVVVVMCNLYDAKPTCS